MSEYYEEVPLNYSKARPLKDEFVGDGWSVRKSDGRFFFAYISGELAGKLKEIEIAESDFEQAKSGKLGFVELCMKFGVS